MKKIIIKILIIGIIFSLDSCVEPYDITSISFEESIVIRGVVTDELKHHKIQLSKSIAITEELENNGVTGATVKVIEDGQQTFNFIESSSGVYTSEVEFKAEIGKKYVLEVNTQDGNSYKSNEVSIAKQSEITDINARKTVNNDGEEQISIYVEGTNTSDTNYYRYEYEETYEILAPLWSPQDLVIVTVTNPTTGVFEEQLEKIEKTKEERICYNTVNSTDLFLNETADLSTAGNWEFNIRNIENNNPIIADRYSILVKQYAQTLDAYSYYKTLKKFSENNDVLSQNQLGHFSTNMFAVNSSNERVLGFFEVSSVGKKRIFFNGTDFFSETSLSLLYFSDCEIFTPNGMSDLEVIKTGKYKFYDEITSENNIKYNVFSNIECGDCNIYGSNIKPDFWED